MEYQPPYGSSDPNASYVDRNSAAAVKGSAVPARAIEDPQREIVNALIKSGIVPSGDSLLQLAMAIRSQRLNYFPDSGVANAVAITLDPPPSSWSDLVGVPLHVKIAANNTGATTLAVAGLSGTKPITRVDGSALVKWNLLLGQIAVLSYDGTNVQVVALTGDPGQLLGVRRFTAGGTYIETPGTRLIFAKGVGGGGAGGGGFATSSSSFSVGSGGAAGSYGEGWYSSGFSGAPVTIGAGGVGVSGAAGGAGGMTSLGSILSCPGGGGGPTATAATTASIVSAQGAPGGVPVGAAIGRPGQPGFCGYIFANFGAISGQGAPSPFGSGGTNTAGGLGGAGVGYGSGGGGNANGISQSNSTGPAGAPGYLEIWEYR